MKQFAIFVLICYINASLGVSTEDKICSSPEIQNLKEQFEVFDDNVIENLKKSIGDYSEFSTKCSSLIDKTIKLSKEVAKSNKYCFENENLHSIDNFVNFLRFVCSMDENLRKGNFEISKINKDSRDIYQIHTDLLTLSF